MIKFPCPHCGVNISAEPEHYGASANCPSCGQDLVVPTDAAEAADSAPPFISGEVTSPAPTPTSTAENVSGRSSKKKAIKFGVLAVLCILVVGGLIVAIRSNSEKADRQGSQSASAQTAEPKQKTNRAGYDAYMTGYQNPEQGDVAEAMIDRFSGGDRQAALLMILGAEDRRKGLPIRFVVVAE